MEVAKRFDSGKVRMDLIPPSLNKEVGKILTFGANKYGDHNWCKGMKWSKCIGSLKRHLTAFEDGIDLDEESGEKHISHVIVNAMFLLEYYSIYPQGDDRQHEYLNRPRIGLDIDDVLCDWCGAWSKFFGHPLPESWSFSYNLPNEFKSMGEDQLNQFYINLPRKIDPKDIPFEPHAYITARSIDSQVTMEWLELNRFPTAPVYTVGFGESKVEVAKKSGIDIFVDDRFDNFVELNKAGICTYLLDAPHNKRYDVGYKRLHSLKDLIK